jgi:glycerol-3-phosphate O-acyltransferase
MLRTQAERDAIEAESKRREKIREEKAKQRAEEYQRAKTAYSGSDVSFD